MAGFYSARGWTIPPLPWPTFAPPLSIVTTSLKHADHFRRNSSAGMVMVNLPTAGVDYHAPFGGNRASSFGPREQGTHARHFFTRTKTAYQLA